MSSEIPSDFSFWLILTIPFIAAFVGWGTNILAIKMTFYPLEFKGIGPIGWQGIIPSKAPKIAGKAVDLLTTRLLDIETLFAQIDPKQVAVEMTPELKPLSKKIIDSAMKENMPMVWTITPDMAKNAIYDDAAHQFPKVIEEMMRDLKANIKEIFDVREMCVEAFRNDKELLNLIFLKCGAEEFKFIERSGLYFGFIFGLIQMAIWFFFPKWWILPLGGLLVGYATNWLALKLIFRPHHPRGIGRFKLQGMFIKRQKEVSVEYANIISHKILTVEAMFGFILRGGPSDFLMKLTTDNVRKGIDKAAGLNRTFIKMTAGTKKYEEIREKATSKFVMALPGSIHHIFRYTEEAIALEENLREKMSNLSPEDYEATLRPAFQEDELTLILVGAALGAIAGFLQMMLIM